VACREEAVALPGDVRDRNALRGNFDIYVNAYFRRLRKKLR
jgi:hypothetical protein